MKVFWSSEDSKPDELFTSDPKLRKHPLENPMIMMICWINMICWIYFIGYTTKVAPLYVASDKSWDDQNLTNDLYLLIVAWYSVTSLSVPAFRLIVSSRPTAGSRFRGHLHNVFKHSADISKQLIPVLRESSSDVTKRLQYIVGRN